MKPKPIDAIINRAYVDPDDKDNMILDLMARKVGGSAGARFLTILNFTIAPKAGMELRSNDELLILTLPITKTSANDFEAIAYYRRINMVQVKESFIKAGNTGSVDITGASIAFEFGGEIEPDYFTHLRWYKPDKCPVYDKVNCIVSVGTVLYLALWTGGQWVSAGVHEPFENPIEAWAYFPLSPLAMNNTHRLQKVRLTAKGKGE